MIVVYSKDMCPYCDRTKDKLNEMGLEYTEINVSKNPDKREFLKEEGHRTVPQIYINGKVVPGGNNAFQLMNERQIKEWNNG